MNYFVMFWKQVHSYQTWKQVRRLGEVIDFKVGVFVLSALASPVSDVIALIAFFSRLLHRSRQLKSISLHIQLKLP